MGCGISSSPKSESAIAWRKVLDEQVAPAWKALDESNPNLSLENPYDSGNNNDTINSNSNAAVPDINFSNNNELSCLKDSLDALMQAISADSSDIWSSATNCVDVLQMLAKIAVVLQADEFVLSSSLGFGIVERISQVLVMTKGAMDADTASHVKRVGGQVGGMGLQGLMFELANGTRQGVFLSATLDFCTPAPPLDLMDDKAQRSRGIVEWHHLERGEYIVEASGYNYDMECHDCAKGVTLKTNYGRKIKFTNKSPHREGKFYRFKAPPGKQIDVVNFFGGYCKGVGTHPAVDLGKELSKALEVFAEVAEPVLVMLATAIASKDAAAKKHAFFLADELGYGHLSCIQALKQELIESGAHVQR